MTEPRPMSLAAARALLRDTRVFAKSNADQLWHALLSLEDADELVAVASRMDWQFHPRGFDNVELFERYGAGIVPWLATRLDPDGVLHNVPWCVVPCLLACDNSAAFALAWRVRAVAGRTAWGGCGDADLAAAWCRRHPEVGSAELDRLAPTDARARAYRRALWPPPAGPATAADILALLDACADRLVDTRVSLWPPAAARNLRLIAARDGDDWGLAIERIDGTRPTGFLAAQVVTLGFGSRVRGAIVGATTTSRPVPDLYADDLDHRLGPASLALPTLGLSPAARIVATVPYAAQTALPSASALFTKLAEALAGS